MGTFHPLEPDREEVTSLLCFRGHRLQGRDLCLAVARGMVLKGNGGLQVCHMSHIPVVQTETPVGYVRCACRSTLLGPFPAPPAPRQPRHSQPLGAPVRPGRCRHRLVEKSSPRAVKNQRYCACQSLSRVLLSIYKYSFLRRYSARVFLWRTYNASPAAHHSLFIKAGRCATFYWVIIQ